MKMTTYSVQARDLIFVKGYGFLSFTRNMGRNCTINGYYKYSPKLIDHAKQYARDAHKNASKWAIQKTAETTGDLIRKLLIKLQVSKTSPKKNSKTNEEILRVWYISPELR